MSRRQGRLHARDCESGVVSDGFAEPGWNDPANLSRKRKSFAVEYGVYDRHEEVGVAHEHATQAYGLG